MRTRIRAKVESGFFHTIYTANQGERCIDCSKPFEQDEHATRRAGVAITPNGLRLHYPLICSACQPFTEIEEVTQ